jgi:TatD DNase family protein
MFFDTHAHLDQEEFDADRQEVVASAEKAGVVGIVAIATTASSSETCVRLASEFPVIHAAVGIHPNSTHEAREGDWQRIVELSQQPNVVALGETGLDRHWNLAPFERQQEYFWRHLELSRQRGLPIVVHMRDCEQEMLQVLREAHNAGPLLGVMHAFSGSAEMAADCVALGLYISFAGMVTYKKSAELRACASTIPAERILIETDSPYLSPEPVRSMRRNEPANVVHTAACLAKVRGETVDALGAQTTANARRLFGLMP